MKEIYLNSLRTNTSGQAAHAGNFRYFFAFQILKTIEDSLKTSIF